MENQLSHLRIFSDWILCLPIKQERECKGLVSPTTQEEKTSFAKVVMLGDQIKKPIQIGDICFFNQYASIELQYKDNTYLILKEEDIIGIYIEE